MELTEEKKFDLLKESSGHFLTEIIPDTWWDMSEEEQNCFLNEHVCYGLRTLRSGLLRWGMGLYWNPLWFYGSIYWKTLKIGWAW